jgi:hypothetical protein
MSRYGTIVNGFTAVVDFVQAADVLDMSRLATKALAAIPSANLITAIDLAGAGDGHTFVLMIEHAQATAGAPAVQNVVGGLVAEDTDLLFYLAGTAEALGVARSLQGLIASGQPAPMTATIFDELISGASQGTRVMGCIVLVKPQANPESKAYGAAYLAQSPQSLPIPGGIVLVDTLGPQVNLFDNPAPGVLRYTGPVPITALVDFSVSFLTESTVAPFPVTVEVVMDPLGTPTPIAGALSVAAPAPSTQEIVNVSVTALAQLAPGLVSATSYLGILLSFAGDPANVAIVLSAHIRAAQIT